MPGSIPVLFTLLALVVPGFLIHSVMSVFTTRRTHSGHYGWVYPITLGAINVAVWSWLIFLLITLPFFQTHIGWAAFGWTFVLLIGPALIGLVLGYNVQKGWARRLLRMIRLNPVHVIPTAWDGRFHGDGDIAWMLVTLSDGTQIAGFFGGRSWASSEPTERDLYLEQIYDLDHHGHWHLTNVGKGALIRPAEIRFIESWPVQIEADRAWEDAGDGDSTEPGHHQRRDRPKGA